MPGMEICKDIMGIEDSAQPGSRWTLVAGVEQASCVYVEPDEFRDLAISNRKLARADSAHEGVCGLIDLETRERFVVQRTRLFCRESQDVDV